MTQQHIFLSVGFVWHHIEMHLMRLLLCRVSLGFFRLTSHGERECYLIDVGAVVWCWVAPRGMRSGGSSICTLAANGGRFFFIRVLAREVQIFASAPDPSRSGDRRGRRSQSPWEVPSPWPRSSSSKGAVPRLQDTGSPCPEVRSGLTSIWWEIRTCRQTCIPRTDVQATGV